jgi:hypothetical protein
MLAFSFKNRGLKALRLSLSEPFPIYFANIIEPVAQTPDYRCDIGW